MVIVTTLSALALAWIAGGARSTRRPGWLDVESFVGFFCMLGMLYASAAQVIVRYGLSDVVELPWTEELSRLLLVWAALWGAAIVQRGDDHIAMTVVYDWLPRPLKVAVLLLGDLVALGA